MLMKERFLNAVISGELGQKDDHGVIVTLKEFKNYFNDDQTGYLNSFLPAAVIDKGQYSATSTKYIFRIKSGTYRVHPQTIADHVKLINEKWASLELIHHEPSFNRIFGQRQVQEKNTQSNAKGIS